MKYSNGYVFYSGPSMLDGSPIVAIATGINSKSTNRKTGGMVQTYILRADVSPLDAVKSGADESICGKCIHRAIYGDDGAVVKPRSCYVTLHHGPRAVYDGFQRGIYPHDVEALELAIKGRKIRAGAYGDPAAVPFESWLWLIRSAASWTGYSHQWKTCDPRFQLLCMASVDNEEEAEVARAMGWRTFRVRTTDTSTLPKESTCPASKEAGKKLTCEQCQACNGTATNRRGSIAITVHGTASNVNAFAAEKS